MWFCIVLGPYRLELDVRERLLALGLRLEIVFCEKLYAGQSGKFSRFHAFTFPVLVKSLDFALSFAETWARFS